MLYRIARFALIAALAAAPVSARAADDDEAAEPSEEDTAVPEETQAEEKPEETTSRNAFAYHGMVVENGAVVEDPDRELIEAVFGSAGDAGDEVNTRAPVSLPTTEYSVKCKQEGVPLPPPFTSSDWKRIGRLPKGRIFASTEFTRADVLVYKPLGANKKPLGLCVALPRGDEAGSVDLLGVICQSNRTGKACFWDNADRTAVPQIPPVRVTGASLNEIDIDRFQDGALLRENCTDCHRGKNVFVIHEDTFMARAPMDRDARDPDVTPYTPIGKTGTWVNPQHAKPPSNCTNCHSLPEFSSSYCQTVLVTSLGTTMPPDDPPENPRPADWQKVYKADIAQICKECGSTSKICTTP